MRLIRKRMQGDERSRGRRGWNDRAVRLLLVLAIALGAFAAGRFTVERGPRSLADAMAQFRAGELPAGEQAGGGMGGGFGGAPGAMAGGNGPMNSPSGGARAGAPPAATS